MNTKLIALLGTTATLVMSTAWVNLAQANPISTSSEQQLILAQGKGNRLNLTDEQKTQMRQIREATRTQIESVLTQEQKDKLRAAMEQRRAQRGQQQAQQSGERRGQRGQVWASLNLTADQQAQIKRIREESRQKMQAVLTPEQQQQMQQMRQERQNRRPSQ
ncbi:hypothetical protein IQ264_20020 [Phormidium sp. LEGE 05292]|uniref:hypothetical protein n=1 Tax=[Phormidium] sp. LEGE 05292 TaxID=767427 RepID=UPI001880F405|nr:hypothetical protein [Phormidium sp. LEGE 05292]MBE9227716.1 hypothetical protein [Phormidium sp. LEGE 05292]